ncbi:hypothetical protein GXM_07479 [Nostoc sphaeroides CCNUC1]|uniref:Uncharacterized protein n=1 Tax=Nostoc sphaeroides CCNUC1 TaxID=2653204 RepID=A0A5P8WB21_9NOSO|nr:hypothetical protein GXM_07479 [Nostoc sphaeroides CCNUC1]
MLKSKIVSCEPCIFETILIFPFFRDYRAIQLLTIWDVYPADV